MRLLITGASGFIGINFILRAPKNWKIIATYNKSTQLKKIIQKNKLKNVQLVKCDLTSESEVNKLKKIVGKKPINVLYLAANSDPQLSHFKPLFDLKQNTNALVNFLQHITVNRLIFFSSGAVYEGIKGPVNPKSKINPTLPYAISKYASEHYIKFFHNLGRVNEFVIIRFFGAYGSFEPERKIYTKLIKAFYFNKQKQFEIYGNGKNLIDAFYIDDLIKAINKILLSKTSNVTIDLCHSKPITINSLVKIAASVFGVKNVKIKHKGKSAEPIFFRPNQKGMHKYFGIKIKDDLRQSLKKFALNFPKD